MIHPDMTVTVSYEEQFVIKWVMKTRLKLQKS